MDLSSQEAFLVLPFIIGPTLLTLAYWSFRRRWTSPIALCALAAASMSMIIFVSLAADSRPVYDPVLAKIGIFMSPAEDKDPWMNLILFFEATGFLVLTFVFLFMAIMRSERNRERRAAAKYYQTA